jgi:uncharacterized membrane protein YczE
MNTRKIHGVSTLVLVTAAFVLGIATTAARAPLVGAALAVVLVGFFVLVPRRVCRKCPDRDNCAHVVLGGLSRRTAPYCESAFDGGDLAVLLGVMLPLVAVPQYWLFARPVLLATFWALIAGSAADILLFVCPGCANAKCPLNKGFRAR